MNKKILLLARDIVFAGCYVHLDRYVDNLPAGKTTTLGYKHNSNTLILRSWRLKSESSVYVIQLQTYQLIHYHHGIRFTT